jgi:D-glycero-D-manno-heptose 1,7-bisphosphate phosphatase
MLVILDRDGVINRDLPTGVLQFGEFELLPGAIDAIATLTRAKHTVVIATNQSAIGKGWTTREIVAQVHAYLQQAVTKAGGNISQIYVADEAPDVPSQRRKPEPGMLLEALHDFNTPADNAVFIGDAVTDAEAAHRAGIGFILVRTGKGAVTEREIPPHLQPIAVCDTLPDAVRWLLSLSS